ncbi:chalcone-flavanone isomerase-domain-containing protein [Phlyctochytrium arcticum]|nr:chalcone-flavanone isomerase-domain-containing protein [Phlyctochytrium arcticum]
MSTRLSSLPIAKLPRLLPCCRGTLPKVGISSLSTHTLPWQRQHRQRQHPVKPALTAVLAAVLGGIAASTLMGDTFLSAERVAEADVNEPVGIEPVTKRPLPVSLSLTYNSSSHPFNLLGLGVRQVTLLNINVYTIGFYINPVLAKRLGQDPVLRDIKNTKELTDSVVERIVEGGPGEEIAIRIEPTRNTDGPHLRNGLLRMLSAQLAHEDTTATRATPPLPVPSADPALLTALDTLRAAFPSGQVKKGQVMVFTRTSEGWLRMEYEGQEMCVVRHRWVADRFVEGYLRGRKVISEKLRQSVVVGINHLTHPETRKL